jgi:hypothetical protein
MDGDEVKWARILGLNTSGKGWRNSLELESIGLDQWAGIFE